MKFPLMAGSSAAGDVAAAGTGVQARHEDDRGAGRVARRTGNLRHPRLEALQCMVERRFTPTGDREPANQGVKAVTCLQGDAVWKAGDDGLWSWELLEHALGRSASRNAGDIRGQLPALPAARRPGTTSRKGRSPSRSSIATA